MKIRTIFILLITPIFLFSQENVGIGLSNPEAKLQILTNSGLSYPQLRLTEDGNDYARIKMESNLHPNAFWDIAARADTSSLMSRLNFYFKNGNNAGDYLTIYGNGNVGINNTSPESTLDVKGGRWNLESGDAGDLRVGNSTYNFRVSAATGGGGAGAVRLFASGGINKMFFGTDNTIRMTLDAEGDLGIGVTSPSEKLHVNGSVRISDLAGSGDRNVIVDSNGKMKIGTVGVGDTDWIEAGSLVFTNKDVLMNGINANDATGETYATRISNITNSGPPLNFNSGSFTNFDGNNLDAYGMIVNQISGGTYNIQEHSNGSLEMVRGGGNAAIGTTVSGSKLKILGPDNDGTVAPIEIATSGGQLLLMDGNEIESAGTATGLHLNAISGKPVSIGTYTIPSGYKFSVHGKIITEEI
ncbi:MAG: hypothetical protein AAGK97_13420 [Bacteroidota bacterium]